MVRIHPDPPVSEVRGRAGNRNDSGAVAQLGERLLCKQEAVGSIPSSSTTGGVRGRVSRVRPAEGQRDLSIAWHDSRQPSPWWRVARVESCVLFNNSEGKAHVDSMRVRMRWVELYLDSHARDKRRGCGWRKHARSGVAFARGRTVMGSSD